MSARGQALFKFYHRNAAAAFFCRGVAIELYHRVRAQELMDALAQGTAALAMHQLDAIQARGQRFINKLIGFGDGFFHALTVKIENAAGKLRPAASTCCPTPSSRTVRT